jgi:ribonuclease P protein component
VNRNFRLTQSTDFKRVRRFGKSYAHPLVVLVVSAANGERTRVGVIAGQSVGNAAQRNRAKRLLREAIRPLLSKLKPGWNVILISRKPILEAKFPEILISLQQLFSKANLTIDSNE